MDGSADINFSSTAIGALLSKIAQAQMRHFLEVTHGEYGRNDMSFQRDSLLGNAEQDFDVIVVPNERR